MFCLFCREVFERHFSVNIEKWVGEGQHEFAIKDTQVIALAIDSARNMTRAADDFIDKLSKAENEVLLDDKVPGEDAEEEETELSAEDPIDPYDNDITKAIVDEVVILDDDDEDDSDLVVPDAESKTAVRIHCVAHKLQLAINDFSGKTDPTIS